MLSSRRLRIKKWLNLWLPLSLLSMFPPLSDWLENRYQVTAEDLILPLILSIFTALLIGLIFYRRYTTQPFAAYLGAILATLVLTDNYENRLSGIYPFIRAVNPIINLNGWEGLIFSAAFIALVCYLGWLVGRAIEHLIIARSWDPKPLLGSLTVFITVIFLFEFIPTAKALITEWPQFFYRPPALAALPASAKTATKPDIYYIVLDRYASQNVLTTQFDYTNQDFVNFLNSQNFTTEPASHNNYPYTAMSIAATMDANYQTDVVQKFSSASDQVLEPYEDSIRYSPVVDSLKSIGYKYYELGSWYETDNKAPQADYNYQPQGQLTIFGHTFTLNSFVTHELGENVFYRLFSHGLSLGSHTVLSYSEMGEIEASAYKLKTLNTLADQTSGGRLIYAHMLTPHDPYYFNADGSINLDNGNDNNGENIKDKYLGQVKYINTQMESLISKINKNSNGQAVIILQSDEGPYPMVLNDQNFNGTSVGDELSGGNMLDWTDANLQMKFGNLAAYHIPAASNQALAQGGDNTNIFRVVLNSYFGANLPYLPRCYYAYVDGRSKAYVYSDITNRLTGTTNPLCPANSDFSTKNKHPTAECD